MILAKDLKNGISKNNSIPWKSSIDMKHFYNITSGNVVIMGKNTFFSLPAKNRPLKNRLNIVLTKNQENYIHLNNKNLIFSNNENIEKHINELLIETDYSELIPYLNKDFKIIVIGGKQIYEKYISICNKVWLTIIKKDYDCDLFFDYDFDLDFNKNVYYEDKNTIIYECTRIKNLDLKN